MALLDKLKSSGSPLSGLNGETPKVPVFKDSKLHNTYSTTGNPSLKSKPEPSLLDINATPQKYLDNLPR